MNIEPSECNKYNCDNMVNKLTAASDASTTLMWLLLSCYQEPVSLYWMYFASIFQKRITAVEIPWVNCAWP
jgi:hypothetical protein